MTTAAEKLDLVPPWLSITNVGGASAFIIAHDNVSYASADGRWCSFQHTVSREVARAAARLTRPLDSWQPPADCPLPVEGWHVREHPPLTGWYLYDGNEMDVGTGDNRQFPTRRAAIVWAWKEAPAPADAKPRLITEADVKVGQVWVCGLPTCEHRRRVDGISGGRVRTTWLSPREGCDSVDMTEFVAYLNRTPPSVLITDGTGATEGPSDRDAINALDDRIGAVETKVEDVANEATKTLTRVGKVEMQIDNILARICPDADSQTDGKGRTLVEIDRQLDAVVGWMNDDARPEFDKIDDRYNVIRRDAETLERRTHSHEMRLTYLERLIAAQVAKPATLNTRSDDASTNELATAAAASDEGWREMLVPRSYDSQASSDYLYTPCRRYVWSGGKWTPVDVTDRRRTCGWTHKTLEDSRTCPPPPNLAEWYKPKAAAFRDTAAVNADTLKDYDAACAAVPSTYRVGDDLAAWVRHLAAAHEEALKVQEQLRQSIAKEAAEGDKWYAERCDLKKQLADANAAAVAAEGRAHTATKRACKAEEELADLRGKVENLRAAFSG